MSRAPTRIPPIGTPSSPAPARASRWSLALAAWVALPLLHGAPARAAAGDYALEPIVVEGDLDPLGRAVHTIFQADIDDAGRVAVWANDADGAAKLYAIESGSWTLEVAEGDPVPGVTGATFSDVARPRVASPDTLAHLGAYAGSAGLFARSAGAGSAWVLPGTPADGAGTITRVRYVHAAAAGPRVAFGVEIDVGGPTPIVAHYSAGPMDRLEIYREGQAAPPPVGGVFTGVQSFWEVGIAADGSVVFAADVSGGAAASGLFRSDAAGNLSALLLEGAAVATPGGGSFVGFARSVGVNAVGDVSFNADVLRAPIAFPREAVFVRDGSGLREIVIRGEPIPGVSPPRYFVGLSGSSPPETSNAGVVTLTASLEDAAQTLSEFAVLVHDGGELFALVKAGDAVPGAPGAQFTDFYSARIDSLGRIAILAYTTQGAGVFLATPLRPVPVLPLGGLGLLALALGSTGAQLLRRR